MWGKSSPSGISLLTPHEFKAPEKVNFTTNPALGTAVDYPVVLRAVWPLAAQKLGAGLQNPECSGPQPPERVWEYLKTAHPGGRRGF